MGQAQLFFSAFMSLLMPQEFLFLFFAFTLLGICNLLNEMFLGLAQFDLYAAAVGPLHKKVHLRFLWAWQKVLLPIALGLD